MPTPRMRTVGAAAAELKAADPNCCIGSSGIRRLVKTGRLRAVHLGRRILINMDELETYLTAPDAEQKTEIPIPGIRAVPESVSKLRAL